MKDSHKQWLSNMWNNILLFLENIPKTIKESIKWFGMSYLMPGVQIFIIWGIRQADFDWSIDIMNIVLVTNASLFSAILVIVHGTSKDKGLFLIATLFSYVIAFALFAISMVEIAKGVEIFSLSIYKIGTIITLVAALLLGLISKYDEVKAQRLSLANSGKKVSVTKINDKEIAL